MAISILEPSERALASELLRISEIYEAYLTRSPGWVLFFKDLRASTARLKDVHGRSVQYTPYQMIRDCLTFLVPTSSDLLTAIRRLRGAALFEKSDLYERLEKLAIARVSETDHKGLFLLAVRAAEDKGAFDA